MRIGPFSRGSSDSRGRVLPFKKVRRLAREGQFMRRSHVLGPTLELIRGGRTEKVYELKGSDLYIGRIPGLDIFLDDARVSRHHARVEHRADGTSYLVDLESKSCTHLDGQRLTPYQAVPLRNGSRIKILGYELIFHDDALELNDTLEGDSTILEKLDDFERRTPGPALGRAGCRLESHSRYQSSPGRRRRTARGS